MVGILGRKIGMSQIFQEDGKRISVTLIETVPSEVLSIRTKEKNGYSAVQLGICDRKKPCKNKPKKKFIREIRLSDDPSYKLGDMVNVDVFAEGDYVDVVGTTKGKGFQGGVKRWGWAGGPSGHGSMHHRRVGSIGASSFPSRVHKGKTMPGHMGKVRRTVQNLKVIKVDKESSLLAVEGPVPGHNESFLVIKEAIKIPKKVEKKDDAKK